jgi:uncharacterized protein
MLGNMRVVTGLLFLVIASPVWLQPGQDSKREPAPRFEMSRYVVGFLRRGPKWSADDTPERRRIQDGHMAHIRAMAESGKLIVAGPFEDDGDLRGMFIFGVASVEEARALAGQDPAVQSGRLVLELHPWFAAKGLSIAPAR